MATRHIVLVMVASAIALGCRRADPPPVTPAVIAPVAPVVTTAPVASVAPAATAAPPIATATAGSPPAPESGAAPSAGIHLHRRDMGIVSPNELQVGSGAQPAPVAGPSVEVGKVSGISGIDSAARVVARLRPVFVRCYGRALRTDPNLTGAFVLEAKIGPRGEVLGVVMKDGKGLPADLARCLAAVLAHARFAPQEGTATLTLPINITHP